MSPQPETLLLGTGAAPGVATGPALIVTSQRVRIPDVADPLRSFREAAVTAHTELVCLQEKAQKAGRTEAAEVLAAQALMAEDPLLTDSVAAEIAAGATLEEAVTNASAEIAAMFAGINDPYIAARATDIVEVINRICRHLAGVDHPDLSSIESPSVLLADEITAAETALLDPKVILGFVTETGGPTSHVAIIARSLGVAAVVGASGVVDSAQTGDLVALDGTSGEVAIRPNKQTAAVFADRANAYAASQQAATRYRGKRIRSGEREVAVAANVGSHQDIEVAKSEGADGIGLLRTEFLFLDRNAPPTEDEQYEFYSVAAESFEDTVVIRTFDIGGDKPASYLNLQPEANPFLGVRGARLYTSEAALFNTQLRAILRAATHGNIDLMLPMITDVSEIRMARAQLRGAAQQLANEGIPHALPPIGVMVEVPAVALVAGAIAKEVDFFSIGTNDLTQYTMAADRTNGTLDNLQDPLHPAVLTLCKLTADAAQRRQIPVSVCGLAAADSEGATVLVSLGINKLSVSPRSVNPIKSTVDSLDPMIAKQLTKSVLAATNASEVREFVRRATSGTDPLSETCLLRETYRVRET